MTASTRRTPGKRPVFARSAGQRDHSKANEDLRHRSPAIPPFDESLEGEIIGSLLAHWAMFRADEVEPEWFYVPAHGRIIGVARVSCWTFRYELRGCDLAVCLDGLDLSASELALAGRLAGRAPVAHRGDLARLSDLARRRRVALAANDLREVAADPCSDLREAISRVVEAAS